jgi:hypothetical protein
MAEIALTLRPGMVVEIAGFDDLPGHLFEIEAVYDDLITGVALTGPLAGEYGEPDIALVRAIVPQETDQG